jgi:hypothetical protein
MPNALLAKTFPDPHEKLRRDMYVYSRQDLEELLRYLTELHRAIMFFHFRQQPRERIVNDYLKEMLSVPQIQEAFDMLQKERNASDKLGGNK